MAISWKVSHESTWDYSGSAANPVKVAKPTYDGAVLGTTGRDERIMSDVWAWITYAKVWDGSKVTEVAIADSEFGRYGEATIDASDDVKAAAVAWEAAKAAAAEKAARANAVDKTIAYAYDLAVGKDVTVVKGRKVPVGTTGRIFWLGATKFGPRVGIETANGERHFTARGNVEVSNPDDYLDVDDLMARLAA